MVEIEVVGWPALQIYTVAEVKLGSRWVEYNYYHKPQVNVSSQKAVDLSKK
jgi:hypothetical protein